MIESRHPYADRHFFIDEDPEKDEIVQDTEHFKQEDQVIDSLQPSEPDQERVEELE